ncbi:hypothetical protein C6Y14_27150 [Streptomyces dioscori]|uniref:Histidine kinase/HSP90-like ATPase domain-containing protein n=1 Tax=Streptomyces dioscori TaxID=2109333 RepID=A0A2P8Q2B3_9ACTN|nr:ATP-binding protein [Streptomyces dioscori]PSM40370.1 hypothetical protein C6Y14_27150 [Streptomyces dioscori]
MYFDDISPESPPHPDSALTGASSICVTAPAQAASARHLRKQASSLLATCTTSEDELSTAELVTSELLSNAAVHGRDEMTLAIAVTGRLLEITVVDHGTATASASRSDPDEYGRGLAIVDAVTHDLRIHRHRTGWRVRARMRLTHPRRLPPAPSAEGTPGSYETR